MARKCTVPGCRSNYNRPYTSTFSLPKSPELRALWSKLTKIPCSKFTRHSGVCIKHFKEEFVVWYATAIRPDGSLLQVRKQTPSLVKSAFPTIFENLQLTPRKWRLRECQKVAVKEVTPENLSESSTFELYKPEDQTDEPTILKMVPNLMGAQDSDMVVELDPTQFVSQDMYPSYISEPGPSSRMEPDSSVMEDDVHLAMTCEVFPVTTEPDSQCMNIKTKGEPPDIFRQDILSATVERELSHFSKDTHGEHSLFEAPILIKEEIVSSEEDS